MGELIRQCFITLRLIVLISFVVTFFINFPVITLFLLYCLTISNLAVLLVSPLESFSPLYEKQATQADAIVILGGGCGYYSRERMTYLPPSFTLLRLQYGAWLHNRFQIPILVTGGNNESVTMKNCLIEDFKVNVTWQEDRSLNTWENAKYTKELLAENSIKTILLVTHAYHMPRAIRCFKKMNFSVIAAPTAFFSSTPWFYPVSWLPSLTALATSICAIREYIALNWYLLRYKISLRNS